MRIAVIGAGYVGLVSAACFAEIGHDVISIDKDLSKINALKQGKVPIYEPDLAQMIIKNMNAERLIFTDSLQDIIPTVDVVFIAVGTPSRRGDGHADLSYVYAASEEIAPLIDGYTVIVNKSTVPVGTAKEVYNLIAQKNPQAHFDVVSNPEFLREGAAIGDFMKPDRIVIGADHDKAFDMMRAVYAPLLKDAVIFATMGTQSSELCKYASNAFLAMKVTFINEMSDLAEKANANIEDIAYAMGLDNRIGSRFLQTGPAYGGSCFPKDTKALMRTARDYDVPMKLVETTISVNDERPYNMVKKIMHAVGGSLKDKKIAVLGLTFKAGTDDMRDAPSLKILPALYHKGAKIISYDPEGMTEAKTCLQDITAFSDGIYETLKGADLCVILTEWDQFRALDWEKVKETMQTPKVVDLRNLYNPEEVILNGIDYSSLGRP